MPARLRWAGLVRSAVPLGARRQARASYRVEDAYLRFWFRVLSNHQQRVEAGQGAAVLQHAEGAWQEQLGWSFEEAARQHAASLVDNGTLPAGTLTGEWWAVTGPAAQLDVLAVHDHRTVAVGEARWQGRPLGQHAVEELAAKLRLVPEPAVQPLLLLWGRGGVQPEIEVGGVRGFSAGDVVHR